MKSLSLSRRLVVLFGATSALGLSIVIAACSSDATPAATDIDASTPTGDSGKKSSSSSSTSGSTTSSSGSTSSSSSSSSSGSTTSSTSSTSSSTSSSGGVEAGADCGDAPTLHKTTAGFFCAFYKDGGAADAGGNSNCANSETCCNPGKDGANFPPSYCANSGKAGGNGGDTTCSGAAAAHGATWPAAGSVSFECASADNCPDGKTCCMTTDSADKADGGSFNVGKASGASAPPASCNAQQGYKYGGSACKTSCTAPSETELCSDTSPCAGGKTCTAFVIQPGFRDFGYCK